MNNLLMELNGEVVEDLDDDEDQCELSSCAPRLLTAGGYNRHHYEGEVRMHVRASVYAQLDAFFSIWEIWQEPKIVKLMRASRLMHLQMMQLFADGHAALEESANTLEETCIPELVYTRRCGYNRILALLGCGAGGLGEGGRGYVQGSIAGRG